MATFHQSVTWSKTLVSNQSPVYKQHTRQTYNFPLLDVGLDQFRKLRALAVLLGSEQVTS